VADLEATLAAGEVVKTTVMRGTLHLVATRALQAYRLATGSGYYDGTWRQLHALGVDLGDVRAEVVAAVAERVRSRREVAELVVASLERAGATVPPAILARPSAVAGLCVAADLVNHPEDARFRAGAKSRYLVAPSLEPIDPDDAAVAIARTYLGAFGPATAADLARWSGKPARTFAAALERLDLLRFRSEDGRTLLDLPDAPRPDPDVPAPVRFLARWDAALLGHDRRERIIDDARRAVVVGLNGDVSPTFLVDGVVAGTWSAPTTGQAAITLTPLAELAPADARAVAEEAERTLAWLRPDADVLDVAWSGA
jgi:hypothetical protein